MGWIRTEAACFFEALRFFTRLPAPAWVGHNQHQLDHATRYFPLVGILVGTIGATVTWLCAWLLPLSLAVLFGMLATLLATGAFHEDGLADSCDGFGGGWGKDQILRIMKDSRVGSYGAIGVSMMLLAKWNALVELGDALLPALLAAHAVSRAAAVTLIYSLDYVREEDSKAKPLSHRLSLNGLLLALALAALPLCLLTPQEACISFALVAAGTWLAGRYFKHQLGGYTGDCLGATQQVAELLFYCGMLCASSI